MGPLRGQSTRVPDGCLAVDIAAGIAAAGLAAGIDAAGLAVDMAEGLAVRCHGKYRGNIRGSNLVTCRGSAMADGQPIVLIYRGEPLFYGGP